MCFLLKSALAHLLLLAPLALAAAPSVSLDAAADGTWAVNVSGAIWYSSAPPSLCIGSAFTPLRFVSSAPASGADAFGAWTGAALTYATPAGAAALVGTLKTYGGGVAVATATFPAGASVSGCGGNDGLATGFPAFNLSLGAAQPLATLTWAGTAVASTPVGVGLAALNPGGLDSGPIVTFTPALDAAASPALAWATLDSHKIVTQRVAAAPAPPAPSAPYNVTALWSASRADQLACASDLCAADQRPDGDYAAQRVEGVALTLSPADAARGMACVDGALVAVAPLVFAWSAASADNWVGSVAGPMRRAPPDASYAIMGGNGAVVAQAGVAGTLPLVAYTRAYGNRTDWAAVASPAGIAWAASQGYAPQYTIGYVFADAPALCALQPPAAAPPAVYEMGLVASVPAIPAGWSYSVVFCAAFGGPTAVTYKLGAELQRYHNTSRLPSVTLTDVGYYSDDGAYYYVWEAFDIPARPWPAEVGLRLVKEKLWEQGVPVAYMQLDDWWYFGKFFFGNVKSISDWHASNASRLFPSGLPAFSDALGLPLQLYAPFWADDFVTPYNTTESSTFRGTKLVTPADAYAFFRDFFALGHEQTNGRFSAFEIDFMDDNFRGSPSMFETVDSAATWYAGLADAALERGLALQLCLPSVTDMLQSLVHPAIVQARASGDYVNKKAAPDGNAFTIGGSALIMGALAVAPSKDTLWTASPQPGTMSDTEHNGLSYTEQPHVVLDAALATLSLGPVGISDGLGGTNVSLIAQAFRCANDSTLLRPSRPISWVDSVFVNRTFGAAAADVRSTHAAVPLAAGGGAAHNAHFVLAWQTTAAVALGPTDLFPPPAPGARLAVRAHVFAPGAAQQAGCVDGAPAAPACAALLFAGRAPVIAATGADDLSQFSLTAVYETYANGAFFLGELAKFVHVSPQRFDFVAVGGAGKAGLRAAVRGAPGEHVVLTAITPLGFVAVAAADIPAGGAVVVEL